MTRSTDATAVASAASGRCLALIFGAPASLRRGRPLHPQGRTYEAILQRVGADTGVPWLDETGPVRVLVRMSRAMGLPPGLPDIYGMAVRIRLSDEERDDGDTSQDRGWADLLFASTGENALGRFVLRLRPSSAVGPLTTLLPVRTPAGPLLLRLAPLTPSTGDHLTPPLTMSVSCAFGTGRWMPLGTMQLGAEVTDHEHDRHDPIRHQLPGTEQYSWVERLREPASRSATRRGPLDV